MGPRTEFRGAHPCISDIGKKKRNGAEPRFRSEPFFPTIFGGGIGTFPPPSGRPAGRMGHRWARCEIEKNLAFSRCRARNQKTCFPFFSKPKVCCRLGAEKQFGKPRPRGGGHGPGGTELPRFLLVCMLYVNVRIKNVGGGLADPQVGNTGRPIQNSGRRAKTKHRFLLKKNTGT